MRSGQLSASEAGNEDYLTVTGQDDGTGAGTEINYESVLLEIVSYD